jgi:hypothetical protein
VLLYLFGNVLGEAAVAFGLHGSGTPGILHRVQIDGFARVVDIARALCDVHIPSWELLARVLLLVSVIDFFGSGILPRRWFATGLLVGSSVAAVVAIIQWFGWLPLELPNQTPFWTSLGRVAGLASDPNALGVVMALSLWSLVLVRPELMFGASRPVFLWIALVIVAGVVSGSRTFLLGLVVLCGALSWQRSRRLFIAGLGALAVSVSCVSMLDAIALLPAMQDAQSWLPQGIVRGVSALSLYRVSETFGSRSLFLDLATAVGRNHWLYGLGADRFREYVPLVGVQSGMISKWTDNANNFFLGLLVELGVFGFATVMVACSARTLDRSVGLLGVWMCAALAVMLSTGPHTDFIEVVILVGFVVAVISTPRVGFNSRLVPLGVVAGFLGIIASLWREQGAYTWWEYRGDAVRWLSHRAQIELVCEDSQQGAGGVTSIAPIARTVLEPMYIPQNESLTVLCSTSAGDAQELVFATKQRKELQVPCRQVGERTLVTVATQPPWSPYRAWPRRSGDRRILGVQQINPARAQSWRSQVAP